MRALWIKLRNAPQLGLASAALLGLIALGLAMNPRFGTWRNVSNLLEQASPLGLLALGQMVVILAGGIDLSIGAIVTLCAVMVAAGCEAFPAAAPLIVLLTLCFGAGLGALNGTLIHRTGVHPLIITLGSASILSGVALVYTMTPTGEVTEGMEDFVYGMSLGLPNVGWGMLLAFAMMAVFLQRTARGQGLYAMGGNPSAARAVGLNLHRLTVLAYMISGVCAALVGVYFAARTGTGDPRVGEPMTLASITPVVVGGTVLGGGAGTVLGTMLGVALMAILSNVLNYMHVSTFTQWVAQGLVILAAVAIYVDRSRA